jgi:hypothetical protein
MYQYSTKCKYTLKIIQITTTFDEVLNHILNMSWLYHFNSVRNIPLMWFHKKKLNEVFHSNKHIGWKSMNFILEVQRYF